MSRLRQQLEQMEEAPTLRVDPLPRPVNPWEFLADELADQEVEEDDPQFKQIIGAYKRFDELAKRCELRTQNRLLIYTLAQLMEDPVAARAVLRELGRCLAVVAPEAAAPSRRSIREVAAQAAVEELPKEEPAA